MLAWKVSMWEAKEMVFVQEVNESLNLLLICPLDMRSPFLNELGDASNGGRSRRICH